MLSEIQDHPVAQFAEQHEGASWHRVWIGFQPLNLNVSVERDRKLGDDVINVVVGEARIGPVDLNRALLAVQEQFIPSNRAAAIERALGPELAEFYRRREEGLSRLESLTRNLVEETQSYRIRLDTELAAHKRALTESFDAKDRTLDEEHKQRSAELDSREQELNKLRQDLDDRSARHARREQSRALQAKISDRSENFTLTRATQLKRLPVHFIFLVLLGLSASLIAALAVFPSSRRTGCATLA